MPKAATTAVAKTNHGVEMLVSGRYHEAVNILTDVLAQVRALLTCYESDFLSDNNLLRQQEPASTFCCFLSVEDKIVADDAIFVCRSPIVVNCDYASKAPFQALLKLSFVVLYNLALTYHLGALSTKPSKKIFRKALGCYEMAHGLQPPDDLELGVLLSLAIANNIGHIHGFLGNTTKAEQCFLHLLSTIIYMVDSTDGSSVPTQLDGFMRNVQRFLSPSRVAPAA